MKRTIKRVIAWLVSRLPASIFTDKEFFGLYQSRGWHATPVYYYLPIPDTRELPDRLWTEQSDLVGLESDVSRQESLLEELSSSIKEFHGIPWASPMSSNRDDRLVGFPPIDAALLYSMIRKYRPRRMIEIGSGRSTLVAIEAIARNSTGGDLPAELTCIDPYPQPYLEEALPQNAHVVRSKVEDVPLDLFETLQSGDILFIDSSHVVRIGGDVIFEILEVLPRINVGVAIHFHDIFLPFHYPREWILWKRAFWSEQYLLQAFLAFNRSFRILWSGAMMANKRPKPITAHFPYFEGSGQETGSFWIERIH